jgi:hypothetical protein
VHSGSLSNVYDEIDVCVIVVVASTRNFNVSVCHSNVFCVDSQIFGCGHDSELDGSFVAKSFVSPFSNGSDFLDGGDTVVGDEDLEMRRRQSDTGRTSEFL